MSDVTASYGMLLNLLRVIGIFLYIIDKHFHDCVSYQYIHFDMLIYQM